MKWPRVPIGDLCLPTETKDPRDEADQPFLYVDIASIDRQLKTIGAFSELVGAEAPSRARKVIHANDVLVSTVRPNLNAVAIVPRELDGQIASTGFCVLRPRPSVLYHKFLFYFAVTPEFVDELSSRVRGAHYPAVSDGDVKKLAIPLPPLSEQRRIVEILDQADALRKKRAEADAKAARILPALFYKMFGDPATNPKGLEQARLGDIMRVRSGAFLPSKNMDSGGQYPVYGGNGINGYHSQPLLDGPVIIIGRVGVYCGSVHYCESACWVTDNALYVAEHDERLHPRYLAEALRLANLNEYAGRAGQPLISGSRIYPVKIMIPEWEQQVRFARLIEETEWLGRKLAILDQVHGQLFAIILHRAFTGELTSRWRQAHMKELLVEMEAQAKILEAVQ